jgi:hypothetical protein
MTTGHEPVGPHDDDVVLPVRRLLVTFAAIALGAAAFVALAGAILATPYLLVRRLRYPVVAPTDRPAGTRA